MKKLILYVKRISRQIFIKIIYKNIVENFINQNSFKILWLYRLNISTKEFLIELFKLFLNRRFYLQNLNQLKNDSKDKIFIIKRTPPGAGLFSNYMLILEHFVMNPNRNYLIDWQNFKTEYNEKKAINGTKNAFEYYWNQPLDKSLKKVYRSKNYYITPDRPDEKKLNFYDLDTLLDEECLNKFYLSSQRIQLNQTTQSHINNIYKSLLENKITLGIQHRSTDYEILKPKDHYIQPTIDELVEQAQILYETKNFEQIFISSDDKKAIDEFIIKINIDVPVKFTNRSLINSEENPREYNNNSKIIAKSKANRKNDKYLFGLEYLTDIYLLSKSNYFIGGFNSGTAAIIVLNNKNFDYQYIFNLGKY